jgi:hypothetical protein
MFVVMVPLGAIAFQLAARSLPADPPAAERTRFDVTGTLVLAVTLAAYALAMTVGRGHFGPLNIALLSVAVVGAGAFALVETRVASPLLRLGVFRNPVLSAGFATSTLVTTVVMGDPGGGAVLSLPDARAGRVASGTDPFVRPDRRGVDGRAGGPPRGPLRHALDDIDRPCRDGSWRIDPRHRAGKLRRRRVRRAAGRDHGGLTRCSRRRTTRRSCAMRPRTSAGSFPGVLNLSRNLGSSPAPR